jgi:catechol 2,3-dioxygenase
MPMRVGRPEAVCGANIIRAAHGEFRVTDLERARAFYVDLLGFVETERDANTLYLRGYEERDHHCLVLRRAESAGAGHLGFRVATPDCLERLEHYCRAAELPTRWIEAGCEAGQGRALRVQDPFGLPLEFFAEMQQVERLLQRFDLYRGAQIMRFDHFNCQLPDIDAAYDWYADLGFGCSEYTVGEQERLWAVWLQRKGNVHDLALMNGIGPRVHHLGFWLADTLSALRACDVLAAAGWTDSIERGPGRHGISNAFFLYLRDPDGNRIELYANDYQVADPDWQPIRWTLDDPRRATFWGHAAPASWFDEAALCESVMTGALLPIDAPLLRDRPTHVT